MQIGVITPRPHLRCCVTGERHYLTRVLETLRDAQDADRFVMFCPEEDRASYPGWVTVPMRAPGAAERLGALVGRGPFAKTIARAQVDMLFAPLEMAPAAAPVPMSVYVLDTWPWEPPRESGIPPTSVRHARRACQEARAIVVPSEYTRRRCLELFDAPLDKMVVAPPGVSRHYAQPHESIVAPPYIIVLGATCPSQNHSRVLAACENLAGDIPHTLVVMGEACHAEPGAWPAHVVRIERCPNAQRAGLFQHAAAVVLPVLHEGSGIDALDVLCAGAVIIAPKVGAIPEVAGNAPVYYNHESAESLRRTLRRVLEEPPTTPAERQRSAKRAIDYSWERCAWRVAAAFKKTAG
ncbi:MAG: glycosyltransferase [Candidatus Hydrogenedentota bacterium]